MKTNTDHFKKIFEKKKLKRGIILFGKIHNKEETKDWQDIIILIIHYVTNKGWKFVLITRILSTSKKNLKNVELDFRK